MDRREERDLDPGACAVAVGLDAREGDGREPQAFWKTHTPIEAEYERRFG